MPAAPKPRLADLGMSIVVLIWGVNFSVTKGAFSHFPPLAFTAVRFTLASALLLPLQRRLEGGGKLPRNTLIRLALLGVIGNTLYQVGFVLGLSRTTASNSALLIASMPVVVAVLAALFRVEHLSPRAWGGIAVATLGVVLVVAARGAGFSTNTVAGDLLTLAAVGCWAAYTLGLRKLPTAVTALRVTTITTVAGTPGLVLVGIPELLHTDWGAIGVAGWSALAYSTLLSLVLAYLLWNRSVQEVGPSRTVVYMCLTPIIAVAAAWVMLGERPAPLQAVGAVLVIGGVLLTQR